MPSGHAQSVAYSLAYITLALNSAYISGAFFFFFLATCVQRVMARRHYIDQVLAGCVVGAGLAYATYVALQHILENRI
jgi:membrane-associated phospholipid phosphatase